MVSCRATSLYGTSSWTWYHPCRQGPYIWRQWATMRVTGRTVTRIMKEQIVAANAEYLSRGYFLLICIWNYMHYYFFFTYIWNCARLIPSPPPVCNFHVLSDLLLIYICKLQANTSTPWWSYDVGLIHMIGMSTEHNYTTGSPQVILIFTPDWHNLTPKFLPGRTAGALFSLRSGLGFRTI